MPPPAPEPSASPQPAAERLPYTAGESYPAPCGYADQPYPFPATYPMPYSPYGFPPAFMPMYPGGPYAMQPYFPIPCAPAPYAPYPMQQYPMQQYATQPRPGLRPVYIVLIIIGVLLVIGGCVAAAILLTGDGTSSFKLGDATVKSMDIEFRDMVITQEGNTLALTGTYDNNSKREGSVYVPVKVVSEGSQQTVTFAVPVDPNSGERFAKAKDVSFTISGATLGSLTFQGSSGYDYNGNDSSDSNGDDYNNDSDDSGTTPKDSNGSTPPTDSEYPSPDFSGTPTIPTSP